MSSLAPLHAEPPPISVDPSVVATGTLSSPSKTKPSASGFTTAAAAAAGTTTTTGVELASPTSESQLNANHSTTTAAQQQQQQQLVQILLSDAGIDEQLGSILKTFYRVGRQDAFVEQLSAVVSRKEQEIEKLCNFHYQDFVQSVDQLLRVRTDAGSLKSKISHFHGDLMEGTESLLVRVRTT